MPNTSKITFARIPSMVPAYARVLMGKKPYSAPEGTLVVLHGLLPHRSGPNTSPRSRLAYALHAVDRAARWAPDNWLRRRADMPVRGFDA